MNLKNTDISTFSVRNFKGLSTLKESKRRSEIASKWVSRKSNVVFTLPDCKHQRKVPLSETLNVNYPLNENGKYRKR